MWLGAEPDLATALVRSLAWMTFGLFGLMIVLLLMLRAWRKFQKPRLARFEHDCMQAILRCAIGGTQTIPPLPAGAGRHPLFLKLWLRAQMSLKGNATARLATLGQSAGLGPVALRMLRSRHAPERLMALLTLGYLQSGQYEQVIAPLLESEEPDISIHAGRALLHIDPVANMDRVVRRLLKSEARDDARISANFRPFRAELGRALLRSVTVAGNADRLRWLQLAIALKVPVPQEQLAASLRAESDVEQLLTALRLLNGESGAGIAASHASHPDWRVRVQVARALHRIGTLEEAAALKKLLTDREWWVRYRAARALLAIPGLDPERAAAMASDTGDRFAVDMVRAARADLRSWR